KGARSPFRRCHKIDVDVRVNFHHPASMIRPAPPAAEFTIRDLAEAFGVTARTLRFYEQKGMLRPRRRGAARIYSAADRAHLALILRGKRVGFSLDEIREMLDLEAIDAGGHAHLIQSLSRFRD